MKNLGFLLMSALIFSCNSTNKISDTSSSNVDANASQTQTEPQMSTPMTKAHDKIFIQDYFEDTYNDLVLATKGLSSEQLNFKPSPEKWSVLECLEHIVITEPQLFQYEKEALDKPATPEKRKDLKFSDEQILAMMVDRSHKAKTSKEMTPSSKYKDAETALKDLQTQQAEMLNFLENYSMEDLRNHMIEGPFGTLDAYQFMLFIPGHTARHTLQINEVKADPNFPKK